MAGKRIVLEMEDAVRWYLVGVIASDGCLSKDGRHIDITAKDPLYLESLKKAAGLLSKVGAKYSGIGNRYFHLQIANVGFYEFLLARGILPRKSLTQKEIDVPDKYFSDFCRGIIDGDGNIRKWTHPSNKREQWVLRIYSSSRCFIDWIQGRIEQIFGAKGRVHPRRDPQKNAAFVLKYGKMAARKVLKSCYYPDALAMVRKALLAQECCAAPTGWTKSKTVLLN